ncbi:hypothetical protein FGIG_06508 [Fasciola gigantica]|uniref:Uncharacterized protein n=1 Tax=Fasciola gigantica TaxID=46835 RepID=A0A504YF18_FASGI|nr:hypothetical protein FGIG_06508 [Fasciola gigantica]
MYIYNPSLFIAPIQPPQVGPEIAEPSDDRSEVAEVEAVYESFEEDLTTQICRQISPFGKCVTLSNTVEAFSVGANNTSQRPTAPRGSFHSPLFSFGDSLNLDNELHHLLLSNTRTPESIRSSGSRLPRRIVGSRTMNTTQSPPSQLIRRNWRSLFPAQGDQSGETDRVSRTAEDPRSSSAESRVSGGGTRERGSSDNNFLADEEEAEAAVEAVEDGSNEMDSIR